MIDDRCLSGNVCAILACLTLVLLPGCSTGFSAIRDIDMPEPTLRMPASAAGVLDQRRTFAPYFCQHLAEYPSAGDEAKTCHEWLRLPESPLATSLPPTPKARPRSIVVIPGIFGECVAKFATPFSDAYAELRKRGHRIDVLDVKGRSSSATNGQIIDSWMTAHSSELQDTVVIAYSKGTTDFMHAAVLDAGKRRWMDRVAALVTVSGVVNGTPLAARGERPYEILLKNMKVPACDAGDGGGVSSLTYREALAVRAPYLASPRLPATYAVVAITDAGSVNPVLSPFHGLLVQLDERNDGQVLTEDAVLPGSQLIAIANADHWSITLPFETSGAAARLLSHKNHFPRVPFALALLDFINQPALEPAP